MDKNENNLLHFPMTKEMKNRLSKLKNEITIDFNKESIVGCNSHFFNPALAYGENPVLDHKMEHLIFGNYFEENIRKMGVYRKTKSLFNLMVKKIDSLKSDYQDLLDEGFEFYASYDTSGFDYWIDDHWYCSACVSFPESYINENNQAVVTSEKYNLIKNSLVSFQALIRSEMDLFKKESENLFYNKKNKTNKHQNLILHIDVA